MTVRKTTLASRAISLIIAFLCHAFLVETASGLTLHVSPSGKDCFSGALATPASDGTDGPLASMAGARNAIRKLRDAAGGLKQPVTVEFADGVYPIGETIVFEPRDSGTEACPITYAAAPGAEPVFTGGRAITGWQPLTGGLWTAKLPEAARGTWRFRQLFVDGKRHVRARRPNLQDYWFLARQRAQVADGTAGLVFSPGDVPHLKQTTGVEITIFRVWDTSRYPVASVDRKTHTLRFRVPKEVKKITHWDERYYLENALAFLDAPGEWFHDTERGIVYLRPLAGLDPAKGMVTAPATDRLMTLKGTPDTPVAHLRFRGLAFDQSACILPRAGYRGTQADVKAGAAIEADFAAHCRFEACRFSRLGRYAVWLREGCKRNQVTGGEFRDLAAGAVMVGEDSRNTGPGKHATTGNEVSDNHIHDGGHIFHGTVGVWVGPASYTHVARNHIHDYTYSGISVGWVWDDIASGAHHNLIEDNHIHDVVTFLGDGGGIYTLGRQPGTVLRGNVIHDITGWNAQGRGIYHDQGSSDMLVENNLCARTLGASLVLHVANRNTIRNNIFALSVMGALHPPRSKDNIVERNIFYGDGTPATRSAKAEHVRMNHNLYYDAAGSPFGFPEDQGLDGWRRKGQDTDSIISDPGFANVAGGDYTLKADSPALKIGFKPFHPPVIGPPGPDIRTSPKLVKLFALLSKISLSGVITPAAPKRLVASEAGLVGWWPMDQLTKGSPTTHLDGRVFLDVSATRGRIGSALRLDGKEAHIKVPFDKALDLSEAVTLSAWINPNASQPYIKGTVGIVGRPQIYRMCLAENRAPYSLQLGLRPTDSKYQGVQSKRIIPAKRWTHVATTYESRTGEMAVYINGELSGHRQIDAGKTLRKKSEMLYIGVRDWDRSYFSGAIDEVKVYSKALSATEIKAAYQGDLRKAEKR